MKSYVIDTRGGYTFSGGLWLLVGTAFTVMAILWPLGLMVVNNKPRPETTGDYVLVAVGLLAGTVALRFAWEYLARRAYEVRLHDDGTVWFLRVVGTTTIRVSEVERIETAKALIARENEDARVITVKHGAGSTPISYSTAAKDFVRDLQARNSLIELNQGSHGPTGDQRS